MSLSASVVANCSAAISLLPDQSSQVIAHVVNRFALWNPCLLLYTLVLSTPFWSVLSATPQEFRISGSSIAAPLHAFLVTNSSPPMQTVFSFSVATPRPPDGAILSIDRPFLLEVPLPSNRTEPLFVTTEPSHGLRVTPITSGWFPGDPPVLSFTLTALDASPGSPDAEERPLSLRLLSSDPEVVLPPYTFVVPASENALSRLSLQLPSLLTLYPGSPQSFSVALGSHGREEEGTTTVQFEASPCVLVPRTLVLSRSAPVATATVLSCPTNVSSLLLAASRQRKGENAPTRTEHRVLLQWSLPAVAFSLFASPHRHRFLYTLSLPFVPEESISFSPTILSSGPASLPIAFSPSEVVFVPGDRSTQRTVEVLLPLDMDVHFPLEILHTVEPSILFAPPLLVRDLPVQRCTAVFDPPVLTCFLDTEGAPLPLFYRVRLSCCPSTELELRTPHFSLRFDSSNWNQSQSTPVFILPPAGLKRLVHAFHTKDPRFASLQAYRVTTAAAAAGRPWSLPSRLTSLTFTPSEIVRFGKDVHSATYIVSCSEAVPEDSGMLLHFQSDSPSIRVTPESVSFANVSAAHTIRLERLGETLDLSLARITHFFSAPWGSFTPQNSVLRVLLEQASASPTHPRLVLSQRFLSLLPGQTGTYFAELAFSPDTTLRFQIRAPECSCCPSTILFFSPSDWKTPQEVTIHHCNTRAESTQFTVFHELLSDGEEGSTKIAETSVSLQVHMAAATPPISRLLSVASPKLYFQNADYEPAGSPFVYQLTLHPPPSGSVNLSIESTSAVVFIPDELLLSDSTPHTISVDASALTASETIQVIHIVQESTDPTFPVGPLESELSFSFQFVSSPCTLGTYLDSGVCRTCFAGSFCQQHRRFDCPPGSTSTAGASSIAHCTLCPKGSFAAASGSASCLPCVSGSFTSTEGSLVCSPCPLGHSCTTAASAPVPCAPGSVGSGGVCSPCVAPEYAAVSGQSACSHCPSGYVCPDSAGFPKMCNPGEYSTDSKSCIPCAAGKYCSSSKRDCPAGSYAPENSGVCLICPPGRKCSGGTSAPVSCESGTFSIGSASLCSSCPTGTYQPLAGSSSCLTCPTGSSCVSTKFEPVPCPAGKFSTEGSFDCSPCPTGTYSAAGQGACSPCPAGFKCSGGAMSPCGSGEVSSVGASKCEPCPAGMLADAGRTHCLLCPAGYACPLSAAVACPAGTYSSVGRTLACSPCPAGFFCPTPSSSPVACHIGSFSTGGKTFCDACPAGRSCSLSQALACSSTADGKATYSLLGESQCSVCPEGFACPTPSERKPCGLGQYSLLGSKACTLCPSNHSCSSLMLPPIPCVYPYVAPEGSTRCFLCPPGEICDGASTPSSCPAGQYSVQGSCVDCPAGHECPVSSLPPYPCPPGSTSAGRRSACVPCPAGSKCASIISEAFETCGTGQYSLESEMICHDCPPGFICPAATLPPTRCPFGQFPTSDFSICSPCPAGNHCHFSSSGLMVADPCASGYTSPLEDFDCHQCPAGFSCSNGALPPVPCSPGQFSIAGSTACSPCPLGHFCSDPSAPQLCLPGSYATTEGRSDCSPCPAGSRCSASTATPCIADTFSLEGDGHCRRCPRGYSCNPRTSAVVCTPGTYSLIKLGVQECESCPAGSYCPRPDIPPLKCPEGSYSAAGWRECKICDPGYVCRENSVSATSDPCASGFFCTPPLPPTPCPPGYRSLGVIGKSSLLAACEPCPAGSYCERSGITPALPQVVKCPAGHFCPTGSSLPFPCPPATFRGTQDGEGRADCSDCPQGFYCPLGTVTPISCTPGHYCPPKTASDLSFPCDAGKYNSLEGQSQPSDCKTCEAGRFCPEGSPIAIPCRPGYYQNAAGQSQCLICPPGSSCPRAGMATPDPCIVGFYCPQGTVNNHDYPCPDGTYTVSSSLKAFSECTKCPKGVACLRGTHGPIAFMPCVKGHYCPEATQHPTQFPCPAGTFSDAFNLTSATECRDCPARFYCSGGRERPDNACPPGFYCPAKSAIATAFPCPAGTFNEKYGLSDASQCIPCPAGSYCIAASQKPEYCPPGTLRTAGSGVSVSSCTVCPEGFYCPLGSVIALPCGRGFFSAPGAANCSLCALGRFCKDETTSLTTMDASYKCPAGYYCTPGMVASPVLLPRPESYLCYAGYYCPSGVSFPIPCPAGTYNPIKGKGLLADCIPTPAGYYTTQGQTEFKDKCVPGYYCPTGSTGPANVSCPAGTYNSHFGKEKAADCVDCPASYYCGVSAAAPEICPAGFYCPAKSQNPVPCSPSTYGYRTGSNSSTDCLLCSKGMYCNSAALDFPNGPCDPGYSCYRGSTSSNPIDGITGDLCPVGGFCPAGSFEPTVCPLGKFNNMTGADNLADCLPCLPGFYCQGSQLFPCYAGYYCLTGAFTPYQYVTPTGHFTKDGATEAEVCPIGTYNNRIGQSACAPCPAGQYCPKTGMVSTIVCPEGQFCVEHSEAPSACLVGSYSRETGLKSESECLACLPGFFCNGTGLLDVSGPCSPGYFCPSGTNTTTPLDSKCPMGAFCPEGSHTPTPCPPGTFSSEVSQATIATCRPCTASQYCSKSGLSTPEGECLAGYFCQEGASSPQPSLDTDHSPPHFGPCPIGKYCPAGTTTPKNCDPGMYNARLLQETCLECPAGFFCSGADRSSYTSCPAGHYCPQKTSSPKPCPAGTFSSSTNLVSESQCISCNPGYFCSKTALLAPEGVCEAGTYCPERSTAPKGVECTPGSYCPAGSSNPTSCPKGTYQPETSMTAESDCKICPSQHYCPDTGMTRPGPLCSPGYVCLEGNIVGNPVRGVTGSSGGFQCSPGSYCMSGAINETLCGNGAYNPFFGMEKCLPCPTGYYCPFPGISNLNNSLLCPAGSFCPAESESPKPCPIGTYGPAPGYASESSCIACDPGYYCSSPGENRTSGLCDEGFYCSGGSHSPQQYRCTAGFSCPKGSSKDSICPPGKYCSSGIRPEGPCDAGFYCIRGSPTPRPEGQLTAGSVVGNICPAGSYCPQGSVVGLRCPAGTFSNRTGRAKVGDCDACTPGFECPTAGLSSTPTQKCPAGFYCRPGTIRATLLCPLGNYCPVGVSQPLVCPEGSYQNVEGSSMCEDCPAGFECPSGSSVPVPCPAGYFCEKGVNKQPCPSGTFGPRQSLTKSSECTICTAGHFCFSRGLTSETSQCQAGYYCPEGSSFSNPFLCPEGHFCPPGSAIPTPCSVGTYNRNRHGADASSCRPCPAGTYCPFTGTDYSARSPLPCPDGYTCQEGTSYIKKTFACAPGSSCPLSSKIFKACSLGTYQPNSAAAACLPCPPGFSCPSGASSPAPCPMGRYCVNGRESSCPTRTFGRALGTLEGNCESCSEGFVCPQAGLSSASQACREGSYCPPGSNTGFPCPLGSYCPAGSIGPLPCPAGTFRSLIGAGLLSQCKWCPSGKYCPSTNTTTPISCPPGYSCPAYTSFLNATLLCPPGSFCLKDSPSPTACPAGTYNPNSGASSCLECPAGYYCPMGSVAPVLCKAGAFCLARSVTPSSCPVGTYSTSQGLSERSQCLPCTPGFACPLSGMAVAPVPSSNVCTAGFYCPGGQTNQQGLICPVNHYCQEGSPVPLPCAPGSYRNQIRGSSCSPCPAGTFCTDHLGPQECLPGFYCEPSSSHLLLPCPSGSACLLMSSSPVSCPGGTYMNSTHSDKCLDCPAGYYCPAGTIVPKLCTVGHYCPGRLDAPLPCPAGTFNPREGGVDATSAYCLPCLPGFYCPDQGKPDVDVTKVCEEGYFCASGSSTARPTLPSVGGSCPPGTYCPPGSSRPTLCPEGTYQPTFRMTNVNSCLPCLPGFVCKEKGISRPTSLCPVGYFCPGGAPVVCPAGSYCLEGSTSPTAAEAGTYQSVLMSNSSIPCASGSLCAAGAIDPLAFPCPAGSYCPIKSTRAVPCPVGTYSAALGLSSADQCTPCPPGHYCSGSGLQSPSGTCTEGYYCRSGSSTPNPSTGAAGQLCPAGFYCIDGLPTACNPGTYSKDRGRTQPEDCKLCPAGFYCPSHAMSTPGLPCPAGFDCHLMGAHVPTKLCPKGHYCPQGQSDPVPCPGGKYSDSLGSRVCSVCPAGHYCPAGTGAPVSCVAGYYCPEGVSDYRVYPCPIGTYSSQMGLTSYAQCRLCPPGRYCSSKGLSLYEGDCSAGYYCVLGAKSSTPNDGSSLVSGGSSCPRGHFCPTGSHHPTPCPHGTFNSATKGEQVGDCKPCSEGFVCSNSGLISPSSTCPKGFFCGASTSLASFLCTSGSYCPGESKSPLPCLSGSYQPALGQSSCLACPQGFFCDTGATSLTPCEAGKYCEAGSQSLTQKPCPVQTYSPLNALASPGECLPCDPGKFCDAVGLTAISGPCAEGHYCVSHVGTAAPTDVINRGFIGSLFAGSQASGGAVCPPGHYCPLGSPAPVACPTGTFRTDSGGRSVADCSPCAKGSYCPFAGASTSPAKCLSSFVCDEGTVYPSILCPAGSFCTTGSGAPKSCSAGTYQSAKGSDSCSSCPEGFFCDAGASDPLVCPSGKYCPVRSSSSTSSLCPVGTYYGSEGGARQSDCQSCTPGKACSQPGLQTPNEDCEPGFFCPARSVARNTNSNACPKGYFCSLGTPAALPCPHGTYSSTTGASIAAACLVCSPGFLCQQQAVIKPSELCPAGFFCTGGTSQKPCPKGHSCPEGSAAAVPCAPGSYSDEPMAAECKPCPSRYYCPDSNMETPLPCPVGFYCSGSDAMQRSCPAGTYGNLADLSLESECSPCPPGHTCAVNLGPIPCSPGFYCPADATSEVLCPAGFFCPKGSAESIACPQGTYNDMEGAQSVAECKPCTDGFSCPFEASISPTAVACDAGFFCVSGGLPAPCSKGHYCPGGSKLDGTPCSLGTFQDEEGQIICKSCPAGFFCDALGMAVPKKCPEGLFCPDGTSNASQFPCSEGSYSKLTRLSSSAECSPCLDGYYCPDEGMTTSVLKCSPGFFCPAGSPAPSSKCDAGFTCPEGSSVPNPALCPVWMQCPTGSVDGEECPDQSFNPISAAVAACFSCPPGRLCSSRSVSLCPSGHYCPGGTHGAVPCPDGTYSDVMGLSDARQCKYCPASKFCKDGIVAGPCEAGFICYSGMSSPTPSQDLLPGGGPCPAGHYCLAASALPVRCPKGTFRSATGGRDSSDCELCQAGFVCEENNPVPAPCPAGFYCPQGQILACPPSTFRDTDGAKAADECVACPAGSYCYAGAVSRPADYPCPPGHFCLAGAQAPVPCPAGTFNSDGSAANDTACAVCPGGSICASNATVTPLPCPGGSYCPEGMLGEPLPCPPRFCCPAQSSGALTCPANHYCPENSTDPIPCPEGAFCPEKSSTYSLCPAETFYPGNVDNFTRSSEYYACLVCPPGSYGGVSSASLVCRTCPAGYYCPGSLESKREQGTSTIEESAPANITIPCPAGHFCPSGSTAPVSCPPGTSSQEVMQSAASVCVPCAPNSFSSAYGSTSCRLCSRTSFSLEGATTCACVGKHRFYQEATSSCICEPTFSDHSSFQSHSEDSISDCQPTVYSSCDSKSVRDSKGLCISEQSICLSECGPRNGTYYRSIGRCECNSLPLLDDVCDSECRRLSRAFVINPTTGLGEIRSPEPSEKAIAFNLSSVPIVGEFSCFGKGSGEPECRLFSIFVSKRGFQGSYQVSPALLSLVVPTAAPSSSALRQVDESGFLATAVPDPLVCLTIGQGVSIDLVSTDGGRIDISFDSESLLNSNPAFDSSSFTKASQSGARLLLHVFHTPGTYVFQSRSSDDQQQLVIRVLPLGSVCPVDSVTPVRAASMILLGIKPRDDLLLNPDWLLICVGIGVFLLAFAVLVIWFYYFKRNPWKPSTHTVGYKESVKNVSLKDIESRGLYCIEGGSIQIDGRRRIVTTNGVDIMDSIKVLEGKKNIHFDYQLLDQDTLTAAAMIDRVRNHDGEMKIDETAEKAGVSDMYLIVKTEVELLRGIVSDLKNSLGVRTDTGTVMDSISRLISELPQWRGTNDELLEMQKNLLRQLNDFSKMQDPTKSKEAVKNQVDEYTDDNPEHPTQLDDNILRLSNLGQLIRQLEIGEKKAKERQNGTMVLMESLILGDIGKETKEKLSERMKKDLQRQNEDEEEMNLLKKFRVHVAGIVDRLKGVERKMNGHALDSKEVAANEQELETIMRELMKFQEDGKMSLEDLMEYVEKIISSRIKSKGAEDQDIQELADVLEKSRVQQLQRNLKAESMGVSLEVIPGVEQTDADGTQMQQQFEKKAEEVKRIDEQHKQEEKQLLRKIEVDEEKKIVTLNKKILISIDRVVNADDLVAMEDIMDDANLSEEEKQRLIKEMEETRSHLKDALVLEAENQKKVMAEALKERKERTMERQKRRQEDEKAELVLLNRQKLEKQEMHLKQEMEQKMMEKRLVLENDQEAEKAALQALSTSTTSDDPDLLEEIRAYEREVNLQMAQMNKDYQRRLEELKKRLALEAEQKLALASQKLQEEKEDRSQELFEIFNGDESSPQYIEEAEKLDNEFAVKQENLLEKARLDAIHREMVVELEQEDDFQEKVKLLKAEHLQAHKGLQERLQSERERQQEQMREKLANRKRRREKELEQQHEKELFEQNEGHKIEIDGIQRRLEENEDVRESPQSLSTDGGQDSAEESGAGMEQAIGVNDELRKKHEQERLELEMRHRKEEEQLENAILEDEIKQKLRQKAHEMQELEEKLASEKSDSELADIKRSHRKQFEEYSKTLEDEKSKQQGLLDDRLKAKKDARLQRLKLKQQKEKLVQKEAQKTKEEDELSRSRMAHEKERILKRIAEGTLNTNRIDSVIEQRLENRFQSDLKELLQRQMEETAVLLNSAVQECYLDKIEQTKKHNGDADKLVEIEATYLQVLGEKEEECLRGLNVKQQQEILDLKRRYAQEKSDLLSQIKEEALKIQSSKQQQALRDQKEADLKRLQEELKQKKEEADQRNREELEKLEQEHNEMIRQEKEKIERLTNQLQDKFAEEMKRKMEEEMEDNYNENEKEAILKRFQDEKQQYAATVKAENDRQLEVLQKNLTRRREARRRKQENLMKDSTARDSAKMQQIVSDLSVLCNRTESSDSSRRFLTPEQRRLLRITKSNRYQEGVRLDIVARLNLIENVVTKILSTQEGPADVNPLKKAMDSAVVCEGKLVVTEDLNSRERIRFDFCQEVIRYVFNELYNGNRLKPVKLLVAISLPFSLCAKNIFSNSYFYDKKKRSLYLRKTKFVNTGELLLVLSHALAHVISNPGDLSDDSNPQFLTRFTEITSATFSKFFEVPTNLMDESDAVASSLAGGFDPSMMIERLTRYTKFITKS